MRVQTASEVSRSFSTVLDEVEQGETIVITRGGRRIAEITPTAASNWAGLRAALADWAPTADPDFEQDMDAARATVDADPDPDPWQSV